MMRFSVLIPVYNRAPYLRQTIDSVLTQTFQSFEVIAVDDGSTDGSVEILRSYGDRIKFLQQLNSGPEVARNAAAAVASGEYLFMLDSDDFLFPSALAMYDRAIRAFDSPPLVLGNELYYYDGQTIPHEYLEPQHFTVLKFKDYFSKSIALSNFNSKLALKRSIFFEVGGFRNSNSHTFFNDDLHLMLKVGTYGPCVVIQGAYTFAYRQHPGNSIKNIKAIAESIVPIIKSERSGEYPGGKSRRIDRYAVIGGRAGNWAYRYCWRRGQKMLALRLVWNTAPMIAAAMWTRLTRQFQSPINPIPFNEI